MTRYIPWILLPLVLSCSTRIDTSRDGIGLHIYEQNAQYWTYRDEPVLLLGGSDEDNLFQYPEIEEQLNLLEAVGGNYVRNTMSSRDPGNLWAFGKEDGQELYNLNLWNEEYWSRFETFLELAHQRQIFIQIEIWATFDYYRDPWDSNPFNPKNNLNYSAERTGLPVEVRSHPTLCENPFFWSIPAHHNNMPLLAYQQRFVDKILSYTLAWDHVFYCIDNETSVTSAWGKFWSEYIRKKAEEVNKEVHVTEMWDPWDLNHISHRESFDHPETYAYVEISQNNHQRGDAHWNNGLDQIHRLRRSGYLRPVHNVKTYGADGGRHGGGTDNGIQSFVRSTLFGSAAVRFHRPPSGLGLGDTAQRVIRGMREVTGQMDFFKALPANELLKDRQKNEAFCRAVAGREYLVYFPGEGQINLRVDGNPEKYQARVFDLLSGTWTTVEPELRDESIILKCRNKHQLFLLRN